MYTDYEGCLPVTLTVSPLTKNSKNSNVAYVTDVVNGRNPEIQLGDVTEPRCSVPFAISSFDESAGGRKNMELSLRCDRHVSFVQSLDDFNIKTAIANKDTWFPKLIGKDDADQQITSMYHRLLTVDTSFKGYPPRLHTKTSADEIKVSILDNNSNTITMGDMDHIVKGTDGIPIVRLVGYWFQPRQWGMSVVTKYFLMNAVDANNDCPFLGVSENVMVTDKSPSPKSDVMVVDEIIPEDNMLVDASLPASATVNLEKPSVLMAPVAVTKSVQKEDNKRQKKQHSLV